MNSSVINDYCILSKFSDCLVYPSFSSTCRLFLFGFPKRNCSVGCTCSQLWDLGLFWTKPQLRMHNYGMTAWIGLAVAYVLYDNIVLASKYGNRLFYRLGGGSKPSSK